MAYVNWNDSMSVNVAVIDEQHRGLVAMINELHEAMTAGQGSSVLHDIVDGLVDYTEVHFSTEERYFDAAGYMDAESHRQQHRDFVASVMDFKQGFDEGRLMLTLDVMDFLADWLVAHIKGSDAALAPYLGQTA